MEINQYHEVWQFPTARQFSEELNVFRQSSTLFLGLFKYFFFPPRESLAEDDSTQRGAGAGSPSFLLVFFFFTQHHGTVLGRKEK